MNYWVLFLLCAIWDVEGSKLGTHRQFVNHWYHILADTPNASNVTYAPNATTTNASTSPPTSTPTVPPTPTPTPNPKTNPPTPPPTTVAPTKSAAPTTMAPSSPPSTAPVCSVSSNCNGHAYRALWVETSQTCKCTCRNYWTGSSCNVCPAGYSGSDCDTCPSGTIKPSCRSCTIKEDCSDGASEVSPNRDLTACTCKCRNQYSGRNCSICPSKYSGDECDRCARGLDNYPACIPSNTVTDMTAEKVKCEGKCTAAGCNASSVYFVQLQVVCSCSSCAPAKTRMCGTLASKTITQCIYPIYTCTTLQGKSKCVINSNGSNQWASCSLC